MAQNQKIVDPGCPEKMVKTAPDALAIVDARFYDSVEQFVAEATLLDGWISEEIAALFA
jgi:hypothetical protein